MLPAEILIEISNHVAPEDLMSWTLTCKTLHAASGDALKFHNSLHEDCQELELIGPYEVLDSICQQPLKGSHIR